MSNDVRITLYNQSGLALTELEGHVDDVAWRLNDIGIATLSLPYRSAPKMYMGQQIAIEFANGLPVFGGVIAEPISRRAEVLGIRVFGGEHILSFRRTGYRQSVSGTRGEIMGTLLDAANAESPTGLARGGIMSAGQSLSRTYSYQQLLDVARGLADTQDFGVKASLDGAQLRLELYWWQQRGFYRQDSVLLTPDNGSIRADEQGPIRNHIIAVGDGIFASALNPGSAADHGRRTHVIYYSDVSDADQLQDLADQYCAAWAYGGHRLTLYDIGSDMAAYEDYDIGDIVSLEAFMDKGTAWALDIPVRIIARSWSPENQCTLEVEEWR